jgi:pyruvate ferredoxin oxidoreductase gamma subunit
MFEVRVHGRGGQGVVTAAELLSVAAFREGKYAQAFPTFGSERTGAPVTAFCRIADSTIRAREPIVEPDAVVVQDPTLLRQVDVFGGVGPDAYVLVNTTRSLDDLGLAQLAVRLRPDRLVAVPATELARTHLGRPLPNAALLGAFAALTGVVSLESVAEAIRRRFSGATGDGNVAAATAAFDGVRPDRAYAHA